MTLRLRNPSGSHLCPKNFRKFEPVLEHLVQNWPSPQTYDPAPLTPKSYLTQLRNAGNFLFTHPNTRTTIPQTFFGIWPLCTTVLRDGSVIAGPGEAVADFRPHEVQTANGGGASRHNSVVVRNPTVEVLDALCTLLEHSVFNEPVRIAPFQFSYTPRPGISFEPQPDGSYLAI